MSAWSDAVAALSPLAYWRMGDASGTAAADSSGNGRNGLYIGSPGLGATGLVAGDSDTAVNFDGTDDRVHIASATWMNAASAYSVVGLVKFDTADDLQVVISRAQVSSSGRSWRVYRATNNELVHQSYDTSGANFAVSTGALTVGTTYMFVATRNGSSSLRIYLNDTQFNTPSALGTPRTTVTTDMSIGYDANFGASAYLDGVGDEFAYFDYELTQSDVDDLYAALTGGGGPDPVSGTVAAALPALDVDLSGTVTTPPVTGTVASTLPTLTTSLAATVEAPPTGTVSVTLPALTVDLTAPVDNPFLWHTDANSDLIYKLNPANGSQVFSFPAPGDGTLGLAYDGSYLWNADDLTIYKLSPTDGSVVASFTAPGIALGLAHDGTNLWVSTLTGTIYKLNPADGSTVTSFAAPDSDPFGLAYDGTNLWSVDNGTDTIYEIDPTDGSTVSSFATPGGFPTGLAHDGTNLWLADEGSDTIYKLDPTDGTVLSSFASPRIAPRGLAWQSPTGITGTVATVAADLPGLAVSLSGTVAAPPITGTIAATLPTLTADVSGIVAAGPITGTVAAALPTLDVDLSGNVVTSDDRTGTITILLPALTVDLTTEATPTTSTNRVGGMMLTGSGSIDWTPPVVVYPQATGEHAYEVAIAHSNLTVVGGRPVYDMTSQAVPRHQDRLIVGNRDVTYWRGVKTPLPDYTLIEPFLYGSGTWELPQVVPAFERPGYGDLAFLAPDKHVVVQRVDRDTGEVVAEDYVGFIAGYDTSGDALSIDLSGKLAGRAAGVWHPKPIFRYVEDCGTWMWYWIKQMGGGRPTPHFGPVTGTRIPDFGNMYELQRGMEILQRAQTAAGQQWTVDRTTSGQWQIRHKDTTTIDATAYFDDARMAPRLKRNMDEEPNRIYAAAVAPNGMRLEGHRYPFLVQGPPAPYPFTDNRSFGVGTTNADTDSGDGITLMVWQMISANIIGQRAVFTDPTQGADYDAGIAAALRRFQAEENLPGNGSMNLTTWRALWNLDKVGNNLKAVTLPFAEDPRTRYWNRTSSGALRGRNPAYDPHVRPRDRHIDVGAHFTAEQVSEFAGAKVITGDNWVGSVDCNLALIRGEHNPGDPFTAADVMPARDVRPGMNVWAPYWDGGTLFHVSAVQVSDEGTQVSLTLDTRARDTVEAWEVINANLESRRDPARTWVNNYRSSQVAKDGVGTWDPVGGTIQPRALQGGRWNKIELVGGDQGTLQRLRLEVNPAREMAWALFGRELSVGRMNHLVPNPLTEAGAERWDKPWVRRVLRHHYFLDGAPKSADQPAGYWPGAKSEGAPLSGIEDVENPISYRTFNAEYVLYLFVWVPSDCTLVGDPNEGGRIMWPQLESGA